MYGIEYSELGKRGIWGGGGGVICKNNMTERETNGTGKNFLGPNLLRILEILWTLGSRIPYQRNLNNNHRKSTSKRE